MPDQPSTQASTSGLKRFNLVFSGEILSGTDPAAARRHFGTLFQIDDPTRIERFFSGASIILRRGLEQKAAAAWFVRMRGIGLQAHLQPAAGLPPVSAAEKPGKRTLAPPAATGTARWGPNPYTLKPYRAPAAVSERALQAGKRAHAALGTALLAICLLFALTTLAQLLPPPPAVPALRAAASNDAGELMLATGQLLLHHDRSGAALGTLSRSQLGLTAPLQQLLWLDRERLLVQVATTEGGNLYRCVIAEAQCRAFAGDQGHWRAEAMVRVPNGQHVVLADSANGRLLRVDGAGNVVAERSIALPTRPQLRIHDGLLFANSAAGPALSVYRYEVAAFAEQLDELLLLPAAAVAAELAHVQDFARVGAFWWAVLENTETGHRGVFRFDTQWNALPPVALPAPTPLLTLVPWEERLLLFPTGAHALQRYAADGTAGTALEVEALKARAGQRSRALQMRAVLLGSARILLLLLSVLATFYGIWQYARQRVFALDRGRHAPMLGPRMQHVEWLQAAATMKRRGFAGWIGAQGRGHIGLLGPLLVLVDHRGVYHAGNGIQVQRHPRFLRIEGVQVPTGSARKPLFQASRWPDVERLLSGCSRGDTAGVVVTMLEARQPLALACAAMLVLLVSALVLGLMA
ncbi:MAG: hypothetical protein NXH81_03085 [Halieaceae bacterium]|uniref:hypothetical protein n=1 Tax=Haliea alexandrii TaxID=2448162 RepID=UPI0013049B23|nr:hypothetical protein [Haliea alexandrii]MCR9184364.1 hypothetical protein [Halieaceae bacterium]